MNHKFWCKEPVSRSLEETLLEGADPSLTPMPASHATLPPASSLVGIVVLHQSASSVDALLTLLGFRHPSLG